jgi:hypothetical protein
MAKPQWFLHLAGVLQVVEDRSGAELADQAGDAEVAGFDGATQLDASQPVDVVDVVDVVPWVLIPDLPRAGRGRAGG